MKTLWGLPTARAGVGSSGRGRGARGGGGSTRRCAWRARWHLHEHVERNREGEVGCWFRL